MTANSKRHFEFRLKIKELSGTKYTFSGEIFPVPEEVVIYPREGAGEDYYTLLDERLKNYIKRL